MTIATPPPKGGFFPLCFSSREDYEGWERNARKLTGRLPAPQTYCQDCSRDYQWQMLLAGRCENPGYTPE